MKLFFQKNSAFTLIEITIAMGIAAIVMAMSIPYLFGTKDKAYLVKETEILAGVLNGARQESITASEGLAHSVAILPGEDKYIIVQTGKEYDFKSQVEIISPRVPTEITFSKLRGRVDTPVTIELRHKGFISTITVEDSGIVNTSNPERR